MWLYKVHAELTMWNILLRTCHIIFVKVSGFHMVMTSLTTLCKNDWKVLLFATFASLLRKFSGTLQMISQWKIRRTVNFRWNTQKENHGYFSFLFSDCDFRPHCLITVMDKMLNHWNHLTYFKRAKTSFNTYITSKSCILMSWIFLSSVIKNVLR